MQKLLYFRLFCKEITKPCVTFSCVWTKNTIAWGNFEKVWKFWWTFNRKNWIFIYFWENLLLKIETSGITSFFYNNFSGSGGGLNPPNPPPPAYATASNNFVFIIFSVYTLFFSENEGYPSHTLPFLWSDRVHLRQRSSRLSDNLSNPMYASMITLFISISSCLLV